MIEIDNRFIFYENLRNGINIFAGAGFSKLESPTGNILPDAGELSKEICKKFQLSSTYSKDLEMISSILKRNRKDEFQKYLRDTFKVEDYNLLYNELNKVNIKAFITTNIDNIFQCVIDNSTRYYLNCVSYYGATKNDGMAVEYVPLHGDILNPNSELYFGKFELSSVGQKNIGLFSIMQSKLLLAPTLFWGYGFHDGSVNGVINQILEEGKQDIWIQCLPDSDNIQFFRDLGCNVIIGTTEQLLNDIAREMNSENQSPNNPVLSNAVWDKFRIPSENQVESLPINDFYLLGKTHWYYVITNQAYQTHWVNEIINASLNNKNVLIVGTPLGGKTILLMQVARKYNHSVFYFSFINKELVKLLCNNIEDKEERLVLVDNCSEDMEAYRMLATCDNIRTIAISDDFMFESSKHILELVQYKKVIMGDIEENEAQRIHSNIPESIRADVFSYKRKDTDKFSMFELVTTNTIGGISTDRIKEFLMRIKRDNEVYQLVLLTAYLTYYRSLLSMDIVFKYFNQKDFNSIIGIVERTKTFLAEMEIDLMPDEEDQDYFTLRSSMFAKYTHEVAKKKLKNDYAQVIKRFIINVSPEYIYKNYVFKRRAYDAELFYDLYGANGDELYKRIFSYDDSAYTLQQWALYKTKDKRFLEAFVDIDKAINMQPNNFSIRNARAIILFEANKEKNTEEAKKSLSEAMDILEKCYKSDNRRVYHAQKFSEFAIWIFDNYKDSSYLGQALRWIKELMDSEESLSYKTKKLYRELQNIVDTSMIPK